jgi:tetratricopeptide (TPR) repeat protein
MKRSNTLAIDGNWDRRAVLRAADVMAGTTATAPLLGESALAQAGPSSDADALFRAGEFAQAGRAYEEILKQDPRNVHAARQRGYVGLLANKFADAETYLAECDATLTSGRLRFPGKRVVPPSRRCANKDRGQNPNSVSHSTQVQVHRHLEIRVAPRRRQASTLARARGCVRRQR